MNSMAFWIATVIWQFILIAMFGVFVYLVILIIQALKKYISQNTDHAIERTDQIHVNMETPRYLGEVLKESRLACNMTQEYVAEKLHVSRQAVSKWENGASEPSTSNLIELAKLYGISVDEILAKTHNA